MNAESHTNTEPQIRTTDDKTVAPRLLGLKDAGNYLSLSYWSLREMVLRGDLPHCKFGKKILVDRQDLDRWIEQRKEIGVF